MSTRGPGPALLGDRVFRRYWAAGAVSLMGDAIGDIALPLAAVLVLHAGAAEMGVLTALIWLPNLLLGLHAGAFADRAGDRRRLMIAADLGRAVLLATVPAAYALGRLTLLQLYLVGFLTGTLSLLFSVCQSTLFVSIVERARYVEAASLVHGSRAMSYVAGPSLGGLLVQLLSAPVALVADVLSFLGSAGLLASISPVEPPPEPARPGQLTAGAREVWRSPLLRSGLAATATINLFNFAFAALFLLYATRALHVHPGVLGIVLGMGAAGSVAGAALAGPVSRRLGIGPAFVLGCALFPAPLMLVPLATGGRAAVLTFLFAAEFLSGVGVMILDVSFGAISAAAVPAAVRSRVAGAYQLVNYGVRPLGSLGGGVLGTAVGLHATLWAAAAGGTLGVLWLLPSPLMRLRVLPPAPE
ncbi:MAG TPA: MFS transporter [Gaiellales bacterium]|nr:MFS transporter [Gaiellales bacterium]